MRRTEKKWNEQPEAPTQFLAPEAADQAESLAAEIRDRMMHVEQQVLAQYTATAAYATIAQQTADRLRAEARADLDRSQSTVIGLIEKLRNETNNRLDGIERTMGGAASIANADALSRLAHLEETLASMFTVVETTAQENAELRRQVAELTERAMSESGWLVSSGSASNLSMH